MATKDEARRIIEALPDDVSMDDIIHALYLRAKFERGEREIAQGDGVPHDQARERIRTWVR